MKKRTKKRLQTLSAREIAYSRIIYIYVSYYSLLCLVHFVVNNESLCDGYYASQYHKSDNHHNLFSFPYINVVFSYLCPSFHLASCLATAYFMKFTLLLTSTASTTAKQQAATTNTIIIIVTLSFLSIIYLISFLSILSSQAPTGALSLIALQR